MASAWQQVDGILKANQKLGPGPTGARRLAADSAGASRRAAAATSSASPRRCTLGCLRAHDDPRGRSRQPRAGADVVRHLPPGDPTAAAARHATPATPSLLARVNSGELSFPPPIEPPNGLVAIDQVTTQAVAQQSGAIAAARSEPWS